MRRRTLLRFSAAEVGLRTASTSETRSPSKGGRHGMDPDISAYALHSAPTASRSEPHRPQCRRNSVAENARTIAAILTLSLGTVACGSHAPASTASAPVAAHPDFSGFWNLDLHTPRDEALMMEVAPNTAFID